MDERTSPLVTATSSSTTGAAAALNPYLLVITDEHARRHVLEHDGPLILGRAEEADIRVKHGSVSRQHARLEVTGAHITIEDLGSHNGTRINGRRIEGIERVVSGDVITLGEATVVLRSGQRHRSRTRLQDTQALSGRLEQEIERALRYDRPLAVIAVDLLQAVPRSTLTPLIAAALRLIDVAGMIDDRTLLLVSPELDGEGATRLGLQLVEVILPAAPHARAGVVTCPNDGSDADSLIRAAVTAAAQTGELRVSRGIEIGERLDLAGRTAVIADKGMQHIYDLLRRLAATDITVLVSGETGVGKELAARAVHAWSPRSPGPFMAVNCAAIAESLLESELFGHVRGAFTGADTDKSGYFEAARGGTLFLDELGELSPGAQAKLLRALDNHQIVKVGATEPIDIDVRVVAATNRDLPTEVEAGRFRKDLYYRLSAASVLIPPLRDRPRDIPALARVLLADACASANREPMSISESALRTLLRYPFPGNVRELANAMRYAVATASGSVLEPWHLPGTTVAPEPEPDQGPSTPGEARFRNIADEVAELEKRRMQEALDAAGGNQSRAAKLIGMPRRTFTTKMGKYGLRED